VLPKKKKKNGQDEGGGFGLLLSHFLEGFLEEEVT
jgi:hypothetical protein